MIDVPDYESCRRRDCERCFDFDSGRDALETENVGSTRHAGGCGCRACALIRAVFALTPDDAEEMVTA